MTKFIGLFVYSFICLLVLFSPPTASAQQARTITIVPPTINLTLNPGDTREGTLKVINDSDEPMEIKAAINDFIVQDTHGTPQLLPQSTLNNQYSAANWVGITPDTFIIEPHQRYSLRYFIQIPSDAKPGGHYAAVSYVPANAGSTNSTGTSVLTKLGTLFYITINGEITEKANVSEFLANPFQEYGPVTLTTNITNMGDLHIRPSGEIRVYDVFGRLIATEKLQQNNIYPTATRTFENTVGKTWMIGPFQAKLLGAYGQGHNLPLVASVTFWVFPWRVTLVIVLLIVAVVLGVTYWKKRGTKIHTDKEQINADSESKPTS